MLHLIISDMPSEKSKAQQFLIDRNFGGENPWFDKENTYYEITPSVMQDYANSEINELLMQIKNRVCMLDEVSKTEIKKVLRQFAR